MTRKPITSLPPSTDPLNEMLHHLQLRGSLYCSSELTAPWGHEMPVIDGSMMFHIVTRGHCWLQLPGRAPMPLRQGCLALVPQGVGHTIFSEPGAPIRHYFDAPVQPVSPRYEVLKTGGGGELTQLTCGVVEFNDLAGERLLAQLPEVMVVDSWDSVADSWLQSTLRFIASEAHAQRIGGETMLTHLADILVIQAIRHWLETEPEALSGWLAALRDPKIGRALLAIHRSPGQSWTVASLAQAAAMSRSGFAARFSELVGESVKQYVTGWRMTIARRRLSETSVPLIALAEELGYGSEAAFCRAFKRSCGMAPGEVRSRARI